MKNVENLVGIISDNSLPNVFLVDSNKQAKSAIAKLLSGNRETKQDCQRVINTLFVEHQEECKASKGTYFYRGVNRIT